jgi:hypothetical protein
VKGIQPGGRAYQREIKYDIMPLDSVSTHLLDIAWLRVPKARGQEGI